MSSDNTKKSNETFDRYRKNRPIDIVNTLYLIFIATIFSFYMHNKYFDITGTRARTFITGSMMFIILAIVSYVIEIVMINYFGSVEPIVFKDTKVPFMPEFWALMFLVSNTTAFCMSFDKPASWSGENGRYFGLGFVLVIVLMFIVLCQQCNIDLYAYIALFLVFSFAMIIAFLQHFGNDPFELCVDIVDRQKEMFVSLFGNINTFGSYICLATPIFVAVFIFSEKIFTRVIAALALVESGFGIIATKSDNVYMGLGVAFVLLFYVAISNKKLTEYLFAVAFMFSGLEIMAVLNVKLGGSTKHLNGIAVYLGDPKYMTIFFIAIIVILVLAIIFRAINYEAYKKIQCKIFLIIFTVVMVVSIVAVVVLGIKSGNSLFVFNDYWGTYRGYIWRRSITLFQNATPMQRIFGYGNETIGKLMSDGYYDEMIQITGRKYDNLHCELLQYMITTGIFGLITHVGFVSTSFAYIGKRMKGDPIAIACLASAVSYFTQSLVNLNQPITTPYFYVVLAAGVGYVRYKAQGYGVFKEKAEN